MGLQWSRAGGVVPTLTRDALWAVLRWLPWRTQLNVRCVCRAWCSVVHERLALVPRRVPKEALPALLHCNLRALDLDPTVWLPDVVLPTTLCRLSWPRARPADLGHLVRLEDLALGDVEGDAALHALCSLHTLTRLHVDCVGSHAFEAAVLAAASLTRLCTLVVDRASDGLLEAMLLRGPASLTRLTVLGSKTELVSDTVVQALQRTPLQLRALALPRAIPLPLDRLAALCELDVGLCDDFNLLAMLRGLSSLSKLRVIWRAEPAAAPALGDLVTLKALEVVMFCPSKSMSNAVAAQLPRLTNLTTLTLRDLILGRGHVEALAVLPALRSLDVGGCHNEGLYGEVAALTQLQCYRGREVLGLPMALEMLTLESALDLSQLGRLTALRRLELRYCCLSGAVLSCWSSLVQLEEVFVSHTSAPSSLLYDLEALLPALRRVELRRSFVDWLPLTSRVEVVEVDE